MGDTVVGAYIKEADENLSAFRLDQNHSDCWGGYLEMSLSFDELCRNMDIAAALNLAGRLQYQRGFDAGRTLAEFCDDPMPLPYFPIADSRPTADRLTWRNAT